MKGNSSQNQIFDDVSRKNGRGNLGLMMRLYRIINPKLPHRIINQ